MKMENGGKGKEAHRLERCLHEAAAKLARRKAAYNLFCERPMRLGPDQLKILLERDT